MRRTGVYAGVHRAAAWGVGPLLLVAALGACAGSPDDDPSGLTLDEACMLQIAVRSVSAQIMTDDVVVTWQDDRERTQETSYRIARQAAADPVWHVVADVTLAPDDPRQFVDEAPLPDAVYTVALDDGCVDDPAEICAAGRACPTATPAREP